MQKCGLKIVNNYFFTHFHAVELDRESKTTVLPSRSKKAWKKKYWMSLLVILTTRPHLSSQGFSLFIVDLIYLKGSDFFCEDLDLKPKLNLLLTELFDHLKVSVMKRRR